MKRILVMVTVVVFSWLTCSADTARAATDELKSDAEKLGYALGLEIGTSLKKLPAEIDLAAFIRAIEDGFKGEKTLLTQKEALEIKKEFGRKVQAQRAQEMEELAEKNRKEEETFLAENKKNKGVVTTESGLQYMVLHEGDGPKPKATDRVKVHYAGTLIDGTEFDSSYSRGKPATFSLNGVVAGWTEALQLMKVGSKYRLFIPSKLAYGKHGRGPKIGPNTTLIFELELLEIVKAPGPQAAPKAKEEKKK